jgi:hypothetical protein
LGDGGAIITNDDRLAETLRSLRDHGRAADGKATRWGYNSRLDNVQAAILRIKLRHYDQYIARRRELASIYDIRLRGLGQLLLPPAPESEAEHFDIFQNYEIEADRRDELRDHLDAQGIKTIVQWGGHVLHQFHDLGFSQTQPYAEAMSRRFVLLPMNTALGNDEVHYICDAVTDFYRKH